MRATIKNFTSEPLDTNYIKSQLAQTTYNIKEMALTSEITVTLQNAVGDAGTPYNVEISLDGTNWYEYLTPTGLDEFFVITTSNITLTVV